MITISVGDEICWQLLVRQLFIVEDHENFVRQHGVNLSVFT